MPAKGVVRAANRPTPREFRDESSTVGQSGRCPVWRRRAAGRACRERQRELPPESGSVPGGQLRHDEGRQTGDFTDTFTFAFASLPPASAGLALSGHSALWGNANVNYNSVTLNGNDGIEINLGPFSSFVAVASGNLANPAYTLIVNGWAKAGASYSGYLKILAAIPEPATYALMLAGLLAVGFAARRQRDGA